MERFEYAINALNVRANQLKEQLIDRDRRLGIDGSADHNANIIREMADIELAIRNLETIRECV